jgi:hypothetical protein
MKRLDEKGADALVQLPSPVNNERFLRGADPAQREICGHSMGNGVFRVGKGLRPIARLLMEIEPTPSGFPLCCKFAVIGTRALRCKPQQKTC